MQAPNVTQCVTADIHEKQNLFLSLGPSLAITGTIQVVVASLTLVLEKPVVMLMLVPLKILPRMSCSHVHVPTVVVSIFLERLFTMATRFISHK